MNRLALVIFDCDGVLVDSEPIAIRVDIEVLGTLGWKISEQEVIDRFVGLSTQTMGKMVGEHLGIDLPDNWDDQYESLYRKAFEEQLKPVPGITEVLRSLTTPSCVASSGSHDKIQFTLGLTGLYDHFKGRIFSASEVTHGKPAPDLFLHAAQKMNVSPAACAVIEDSPYGVEAARSAGMMAFGYCGGLTKSEKLRGERTVVFEDMRQLPTLLAERFVI